MASIFSQTLFQRQMANAVSHLAGLGSSGARAVSSLPHPKSSSSKTDKKAKHSATTAVIPETFTEVKRVRRQGPGQSWVQSHTSAQSFFENKTGFPQHQLETPPALPSPSLLRQALLSYTHALRSVQYSQRRGFETKRSQETSNGRRNGRDIFIALTLFTLYILYCVFIRMKGEATMSFQGISNVTFDDVRGAPEAKQELKDVVNFLRDPEKYATLGAKLQKGVLLVGPPGVGKSLLARAVAGEAKVPFFRASGSVFDVGLGDWCSRQLLFTLAKAQAPCIIFIDKLDSVGAKCTSSALHPHANQCVNQLLSEMDRFAQNKGIIVMGATNKVDNIDKALRQPGRFDMEVTVSLPDLKGRKEIIEHYISKIKKDPSVDVDRLAKGTIGFSGAELENMVNQAAQKAVITTDLSFVLIKRIIDVTMKHLEHARYKIMWGPDGKHRIPDEEANWIAAYHEAGHTLVAYFTSDATPLHKVTIIPPGQSLGHTSFIDEKEVYNVSQLRAQMDVGMGGRAAEEIIFGPDMVTTGVSSDLVMTTRIATAIVNSSGMSDKESLRVFSDSELSIMSIMQESYERAKAILTKQNSELHALAKALMKYETLDKDEIRLVCEGKALSR